MLFIYYDRQTQREKLDVKITQKIIDSLFLKKKKKKERLDAAAAAAGY